MLSPSLVVLEVWSSSGGAPSLSWGESGSCSVSSLHHRTYFSGDRQRQLQSICKYYNNISRLNFLLTCQSVLSQHSTPHQTINKTIWQTVNRRKVFNTGGPSWRFNFNVCKTLLEGGGNCSFTPSLSPTRPCYKTDLYWALVTSQKNKSNCSDQLMSR